MPVEKIQWPLSVPTSFQFGSREEISRANVQMSVTSVSLSALPSTTLPSLSRVTEIICDTKRTVICAVRSLDVRIGDIGFVDGRELGLDFFAARFAILDGGFKSVINFGRQQILQRAALAVCKRQHDHLVGALGTRDEMLRIERRIARSDLIEAERERGSGSGNALPAIRRRDRIGRRRKRRDIACRCWKGDDIARASARDFARGIVALERRALISGALTEHVAQAQENKDGQSQKNDGVNIHVAFTF